jgi:hypothetical protein
MLVNAHLTLFEDNKMIDFVLSIFSNVLQMDMRDHHDIPFALPLVVFIIGGGLVGYTVVRLIPEKKDEEMD